MEPDTVFHQIYYYIAILVIVTVVVWFLQLPFGWRMPKNPKPGPSTSAPKYAPLHKKYIFTAITSLTLTTIIYYLIEVYRK